MRKGCVRGVLPELLVGDGVLLPLWGFLEIAGALAGGTLAVKNLRQHGLYLMESQSLGGLPVAMGLAHW